MDRRLMVVRHAKSAWDTDAPTDHARPLNARGRRDAPRIGAHLSSIGWVPELVLSSDAARTRQTWARMAPSFPDAEIRFTEDLYLVGADTVIDAIAEIEATVTTLMVLGHNPGWEDLVEELSGAAERITTANAALLHGEGVTWAEAIEARPWRLEKVVRPKEL